LYLEENGPGLGYLLGEEDGVGGLQISLRHPHVVTLKESRKKGDMSSS
jgi:hypothetical protein